MTINLYEDCYCVYHCNNRSQSIVCLTNSPRGAILKRGQSGGKVEKSLEFGNILGFTFSDLFPLWTMMTLYLGMSNFESSTSDNMISACNISHLRLGLVEYVAGHVPERLLLLVELGGQHRGV